MKGRFRHWPKPAKHWQRGHPLSMLLDLRWWFLPVLLPPVRAFTLSVSGDILGWQRWAWGSLLVVGATVGLGFILWRLERYRWEPGGFRTQTGFLLRRDDLTPLASICRAEFCRTVWWAPFGVTEVRLWTPGRPKPFFTAILTHNQAAALIEILGQPAKAEGDSLFPRSRIGRILFAAAAGSNTLGGVLLLSGLISHAGQLFGKELSEQLGGNVWGLAAGAAERLSALTTGVPIAAVTAACLILAGWLAGFIQTLLSWRAFKAVAGCGAITLFSGSFIRRKNILFTRHVTGVSVRRSLLGHFCGISTVYLLLRGGPRQKAFLLPLLPAFRPERDAAPALPIAAGGALSTASMAAKPQKGALLQFWGVGLTIGAILPLGGWMAGVLWPDWGALFAYAILMGLLPVGWWLAVQWVDYKTGGLLPNGPADNTLTAACACGFALCRNRLGWSKMTRRQSFWQRRSQRCDIWVWGKDAGGKSCHCRGLGFADAGQLWESLIETAK